MNAHDLKLILSSNHEGLVIEFGEGVEDIDAYPETNMRARLLGVEIRPDDIAILKVDYSLFDEFNKSFESANYWDNFGTPRLTAREAGYYKAQEDIAVTASRDLASVVSILDDKTRSLISEYEASSHKNYVRWLEDQLMAARASK